MRVGLGYDAHRFGDEEATHIRIGGVDVPHDRGLLAHSDGDVVLHALCDAMLGAAALGDIGRHFPDSDPIYSGADSRQLLEETARKVAAAGYRFGNADITLIAEAPRVAKFVEDMRAAIAGVLGADIGSVSVKATTTEQMGFEGRREGIAAQAVVLLTS